VEVHEWVVVCLLARLYTILEYIHYTRELLGIVALRAHNITELAAGEHVCLGAVAAFVLWK